VTQALDAARLERVARLGQALLPDAQIDWGLSPRTEVGAWAWADGHIRVSRALVDLLDDNELAAALSHELGHLLDRGDLPDPPVSLLHFARRIAAAHIVCSSSAPPVP
jgi:Zn-dependent protease with chaperone function